MWRQITTNLGCGETRWLKTFTHFANVRCRSRGCEVSLVLCSGAGMEVVKQRNSVFWVWVSRLEHKDLDGRISPYYLTNVGSRKELIMALIDKTEFEIHCNVFRTEVS